MLPFSRLTDKRSAGDFRQTPRRLGDMLRYTSMQNGKKEPLSPDVTLFRCGRLLRWFMVLPGGT